MRKASFRASVVASVVVAMSLAACGSSGGNKSASNKPSLTSGNTTQASSAASSPTGAASSNGATDRPTGNPHVVFAVAGYSVSFLPVTLAVDAGLFKAEGLDADLIQTGGGAQTLAGVSGGSATFGAIVYSDGLVASSKGQPIASLAPLSVQYTTDLVMSAKSMKKFGITSDMSIKDRVQHAKGAKIAVTSRGSGGDKVVRYILQQYGLNPDKDVTIVNISQNGQEPALEAGQIDAFANSSPITDLAVKAGAEWWIRPSQGDVPSLNGFTYVSLASLPSVVNKHPDWAKAALRGLQAAVDMLKNDPDKAIPYILPHIKGLTADDLKSILKDASAYLPDSLVLTEKGFQQNLDFLKSVGQPVDVTFAATSNTALSKAATG